MRPVKRIAVSERDRHTLANSIGRPMKVQDQPADYARRVVRKPWGYEFLVFGSDAVGIWFLRINKDHATSMHCHASKKTSLILLSGRALCNTFLHRNFLLSGDALTMEAGVFHSTKALSLDGVYVLEVETPPNKPDLVRLADGYGRETTGYEGTQEMVTEELDRFHFFAFQENPGVTQTHTKEGGYSVSLEPFLNADDFMLRFRLEPGALYVVCRGRVMSGGRCVANVGDVERGTFLEQCGKLSVDSPVTLMKITTFR